LYGVLAMSPISNLNCKIEHVKTLFNSQCQADSVT